MRVICAEASRPDFVMEMTTVDVSVNGMRLSSPYHLLPGQRLRIRCSFCHAVAVVIYAASESADRPDHWHVGVQFLTLKIMQARGVFLSVQV
jgi:LSD1 subclass zinc finger protein